jgi:predicted aminopeptidase
MTGRVAGAATACNAVLCFVAAHPSAASLHATASEETLLAGKQQRLGELKFEYSQLRQSWQGYTGYDQWFDRALSNADFVAIATYQRCVPAFEQLLASVSGDLPRFYDEVKKMARQEKLTRHRFCQEGD